MNLKDFSLPMPAAPYWWIVIPGQPESKKRYARRGKRTYNPSRDKEHDFAWHVKTIYTATEPDTQHLWGLRSIFYCRDLQASRRDGDNMQKFVRDALQGVVWKNDFQVREGYEIVLPVNEKPHTELLIYHLPTAIAMGGR